MEIQNLPAQTIRPAAVTAVLLWCIETHVLLRGRLEKMALELITCEQVIKNTILASWLASIKMGWPDA
jgi:hypothetical protein